VIEIVLTRLHRCTNVPEAEEHEGKAVADYIVAAQDAGDAPTRCAVGKIHENLFWAMTAIRPADLRIQPTCASSNGRNYKKGQ
jgi:hypothetical protein